LDAFVLVLVLVVVVAGSGAGLSASTKPWRRTSWSSSASGHRRRLDGEARWRPDKAVRRAAHPVMRLVRPPAAAGQSRCPSSSAPPRQRRRWHCRHRRVVASLLSLSLVLITFTATIALASAIAAAVAVAANAAAEALR
jgi:hypothetical protein